MRNTFFIAALTGIVCGALTLAYVNHRFARQVTSLEGRLASVEKIVQQREKADPLTPSECSVEEGLGESRNRPCRVTAYRLLQAPQQFHGRWIKVSGSYLSGFETSALYSSVPNMSELGIVQQHSAIWVEPGIESVEWTVTKKTLVGRFFNGPSGHLSAYFGKLTEAMAVANDGKN